MIHREICTQQIKIKWIVTFVSDKKGKSYIHISLTVDDCLPIFIFVHSNINFLFSFRSFFFPFFFGVCDVVVRSSQKFAFFIRMRFCICETAFSMRIYSSDHTMKIHSLKQDSWLRRCAIFIISFFSFGRESKWEKRKRKKYICTLQFLHRLSA